MLLGNVVRMEDVAGISSDCLEKGRWKRKITLRHDVARFWYVVSAAAHVYHTMHISAVSVSMFFVG